MASGYQPFGGGYPQSGAGNQQLGPGYPPPGPGYPQPGPGYQQGAPPAGQNWIVPNEDVEDNEHSQPTAPPPPDFSQFPTFKGYDHVGGPGQFAAIPAPALPPPRNDPPPHMQFEGCAQLSEDECRESLLEHVGQFCCYGKGPAKNMDMKKFLASTALRYKLETFCEARTTSYEHEPFNNQFVDGPHCGTPPGPWDIAVEPTKEFFDHEKLCEVPHTASVMVCHGCGGGGRNQCHRCHGRGRVRCSSCSGSGYNTVYRDGRDERESCTWCSGSGRRRCTTCHGDGRVTCKTCDGHCKLKWFVRLTVNFKNHVDDFILETTDLPDHLVRDVTANTVFEQTMFYCYPIVDYPAPNIGEKSIELIEKHKVAYKGERRLNQRQKLLAIPVTEIYYLWKGKDMRFWVYGLDKKVYCPDYPAQCCCGCSIL